MEMLYYNLTAIKCRRCRLTILSKGNYLDGLRKDFRSFSSILKRLRYITRKIYLLWIEKKLKGFQASLSLINKSVFRNRRDRLWYVAVMETLLLTLWKVRVWKSDDLRITLFVFYRFQWQMSMLKYFGGIINIIFEIIGLRLELS